MCHVAAGVCRIKLGRLLAWRHPDVFGCAASLSGSFEIERHQLLRALKQPTQTPPPSLRVYLDSGVVSMGGGDDGRKQTAAVADTLRALGWQEGVTLLHYVDERLLAEVELEGTGLARISMWRRSRPAFCHDRGVLSSVPKAGQALCRTQPAGGSAAPP